MNYYSAMQAVKNNEDVQVMAGPNEGFFGKAVDTMIIFGQDHITIEAESGKRRQVAIDAIDVFPSTESKSEAQTIIWIGEEITILEDALLETYDVLNRLSLNIKIVKWQQKLIDLLKGTNT